MQAQAVTEMKPHMMSAASAEALLFFISLSKSGIGRLSDLVGDDLVGELECEGLACVLVLSSSIPVPEEDFGTLGSS